APRFVRTSFGHVAERETIHLVLLEVDDHAALDRPADVATLEVIDVVPPVVVEDILHHRCTEQVAHLATGHPDLQLADRVAVQVIPLLNVHAVDAAREADTGSQQSERERTQACPAARAGNQGLTWHGGPSKGKMRNNGRR